MAFLSNINTVSDLDLLSVPSNYQVLVQVMSDRSKMILDTDFGNNIKPEQYFTQVHLRSGIFTSIVEQKQWAHPEDGSSPCSVAIAIVAENYPRHFNQKFEVGSIVTFQGTTPVTIESVVFVHFGIEENLIKTDPPQLVEVSYRIKLPSGQTTWVGEDELA